MNATWLKQKSWLIFHSRVHSTNCKHIKEQCLDLKPNKEGREVLLDLSKDAEIV